MNEKDLKLLRDNPRKYDEYLTNEVGTGGGGGANPSGYNNENWDSTYTTVYQNSADWAVSGTDVDLGQIPYVSGNWDSAYNSICSLSANWDSTYQQVYSLSSGWGTTDLGDIPTLSSTWISTYNQVCSLSADWANHFDSTDIASASASWDSVYTSVNDTSGNWDSVYTSVNGASGDWLTQSSANPIYVNLSGDNMTGSLSIEDGSLFSFGSGSIGFNIPNDRYELSLPLKDSYLDTSIYTIGVNSDPSVAKNGAAMYFDGSFYSRLQVGGTVFSYDSGTYASYWASSVSNGSINIVTGNSNYIVFNATATGELYLGRQQNFHLDRGTGDARLTQDNQKIQFGASQDSSITYDGTDLVINPKEVGTGSVNVAGNIVPSVSGTYDLGTSSLAWRDIYLSGGTIYMGDEIINDTVIPQWNQAVLDVPYLSGQIDDNTIYSNYLSGQIDSNTSYVNYLSSEIDNNTLYSNYLSGQIDINTLAITDNTADITLISNTSGNWDSVYTQVQSESSNWIYQGTDLKALSSNWESTYNQVGSLSSGWGTTDLGDIPTLSSTWVSTYQQVCSLSADWANHFDATAIIAASGGWDQTVLDVPYLSGQIDINTTNITNMGSASANWITQSSANSLYVNVTGDVMTGDLNMGSNFITNVLDPVSAQDAATKNYVDNAGSTARLITDQSGGTSDTYGVLAGLVNGSNTVYTVSNSVYITGTLRVYLNGQLQTQGSSEDWVETSPEAGTFTFITAPLSGDEITVSYHGGSGTSALTSFDNLSYVDRGDPAAHDFLVGDLTLDLTWRELDLSSIIPSGVKAVVLRVAMNDTVAGTYIQLRKNGNSNATTSFKLISQGAGLQIESFPTIAVDSNGKLSYTGSAGITGVWITVVGWFLEENITVYGGSITSSVNVNSNTITNVADPVSAQDAATKNYVDEKILTEDTTVNIPTGLTTPQIQAIIDAQPHVLNNYTLTFQFGVETHTLTESLKFVGFNSGVIIRGADTTTSLNTSQTTIFDGSGINDNCILVQACDFIYFYNLKVLYDSTGATTYNAGIWVDNSKATIKYCWFVGENTTWGRGIFTSLSEIFVNANYFTFGQYGMYIYNASSCFSRDNATTGTSPARGINSRASSVYLQTDNITGSTSNILREHGGQVFPYDTLTEPTTVTVPSGLTSAELNTYIAALPHQLNGFNLTINFPAETHTITARINLIGFVGGVVLIKGNNTTSGKNTSQTTIFDGSAYAGDCILVFGCTEVRINNFKVLYDSSTSNRTGIDFQSSNFYVFYSWFVGENNTSSSGYGVRGYLSKGYIYQNYFTYGAYGIYAYLSSDIYARDNATTGTQPNYGFLCTSSTVYLLTNNLTGVTGLSVANAGGQILS